MFEEQKFTFSDKKIIAQDLRNVWFKVRFGRLVDIIFLAVMTVAFLLGVQSKWLILGGGLSLAYLGALLATIRALRQEFQSEHKYVGEFVVRNKHWGRFKYLVDIGQEYIVVPDSFYDKVKVGNWIRVERLASERVFRLELLETYS